MNVLSFIIALFLAMSSVTTPTTASTVGDIVITELKRPGPKPIPPRPWPPKNPPKPPILKPAPKPPVPDDCGCKPFPGKPPQPCAPMPC